MRQSTPELDRLLVGRNLVVALTASFVIGLDQLTKWLVVTVLLGESGSGRLELVVPWLAITYVENTGAAFGMLQGYSGALLMVAVAAVAAIAVIFQHQVASSRVAAAAVGMIVGGALGNIVDRAQHGFVIDFVAVGRFPTFNVADAAITTGAALLVIATLMMHRASRQSRTAATRGLSHVNEQ